jgi:hypothetical protein
MFNKIEFSDLYKFLTSIGLILFASAFLLPWLFMREGLTIQVTKKYYNSLTIESQQLTDKRIEFSSFVISSIPWISAGLFLLAIILIGIGLYNWKRKQNRVDETEELNLTELRTKVKRLNSYEINEKANLEVKEEIISESVGEVNEPQQNYKYEDNINLNQMKNNLIDIENVLYEKILDFNSFDFKVNANIKFDNNLDIDILLNSYNVKKSADILIDIKYLQNKLSMQFVRDSYKKFRYTFSSYVSKSKREAKMKFVIVYKNDIAKTDEINRFILACKEFEREINNVYVKFFIISNLEVNSFDIKQLLS